MINDFVLRNKKKNIFGVLENFVKTILIVDCVLKMLCLFKTMILGTKG
jgi:hypothetical protein